ncbi:MAG: HEAT repeat domain-containing protein [Spirochaetia bacterium]|jgi:HEAT repeat protein|nr:HEAT repeat domain-containing protein [Spirochaetia bacterium]
MAHKFYIIPLIALVLFVSCGRENLKRQAEEEKAIQKSIEMYHSPDWLIRLNGIEAVKNPPHPKGWSQNAEKSIVTFLIGATEDAHPAIRIEAVKSLAPYNSNKNVIGRLKEICMNDGNNVRWTALDVLSQSSAPETLDVFIANVSSIDILIREASIKGIMRVSNDSLKQDVLPYILAAIQDQAIGVRIAALENLKFKDDAIYQALAKCFQEDGLTVSLLASLLKAINGYKIDSATWEKIVPLLTHADTGIRLLALRALKNGQSDL